MIPTFHFFFSLPPSPPPSPTPPTGHPPRASGGNFLRDPNTSVDIKNAVEFFEREFDQPVTSLVLNIGKSVQLYKGVNRLPAVSSLSILSVARRSTCFPIRASRSAPLTELESRRDILSNFQRFESFSVFFPFFFIFRGEKDTPRVIQFRIRDFVSLQ